MDAVERKRPKKRLGENGNGSDDERNKLPRSFDWRTTDEEEIELRRLRARDEQPRIRNLEPAWKIFSRFEVISRSGMTYSVELRSLARRIFSCTCTDFRINGLGTCKHVEAVLLHLDARFPKAFAEAQENGSDRIDVAWDEPLDTLRIENATEPIPETLSEYFDTEGLLRREYAAEEVVEKLGRLAMPALRISQEISHRLENRRRQTERLLLRRDYEEKVQAGIFPPAGLLQMRIRATRHLHPESGVANAPLSDEERARIASRRDGFRRKLKMARILAAEDLPEEARDALRDAILSAGRVIAGEARLPEPEKLEEVLFSPLAARWGDNQPLVREFLANPASDPGPLLRALQSLD